MRSIATCVTAWCVVRGIRIKQQQDHCNWRQVELHARAWDVSVDLFSIKIFSRTLVKIFIRPFYFYNLGGTKASMSIGGVFEN